MSSVYNIGVNVSDNKIFELIECRKERNGSFKVINYENNQCWKYTKEMPKMWMSYGI